MKDYEKPCIGDPDHIIFHRNKRPLFWEKRSFSITDLAKGLVNDKRKITIPSIIPRDDEWNNKAGEVNDQLKEMRQNAGINLDYRNQLSAKKHLSNSKLDLNEMRSTKLSSLFLSYILESHKWHDIRSPKSDISKIGDNIDDRESSTH